MMAWVDAVERRSQEWLGIGLDERKLYVKTVARRAGWIKRVHRTVRNHELVGASGLSDPQAREAFLTRVAMHAESVDHHPEFTSRWNRIDFRLTSHDSGGVTERDIRLAEAISRMAG